MFHSFTTYVVVLSLVLVPPAGIAYGAAPLIRRTAEQELAERLEGRILPDGSALHAELLPHVTRLRQAQARLFPALAPQRMRFVIVESWQPNAVAYVNPQSNEMVVGVTTALLGTCMQDERGHVGAAGDERGVIRIIGALARAMAHPVDRADPNGLANRFGASSSQMQELRADTEGVALLRSAGYPDQAIYEAQLRLRDRSHTPNALTMTRAGEASRPQDTLRAVLNGLAVTGGRYRFGTPPVQARVGNGERIAEALLAMAPIPAGRIASHWEDIALAQAYETREFGRRAQDSRHLAFTVATALGERFTEADAVRAANELVALAGARTLSNGIPRPELERVPLFQSDAYANEVFRLLGLTPRRRLTDAQRNEAVRRLHGLLTPERVQQLASRLPSGMAEAVLAGVEERWEEQRRQRVEREARDRARHAALNASYAADARTSAVRVRDGASEPWRRRELVTSYREKFGQGLFHIAQDQTVDERLERAHLQALRRVFGAGLSSTSPTQEVLDLRWRVSNALGAQSLELRFAATEYLESSHGVERRDRARLLERLWILPADPRRPSLFTDPTTPLLPIEYLDAAALATLHDRLRAAGVIGSTMDLVRRMALVLDERVRAARAAPPDMYHQEGIDAARRTRFDFKMKTLLALGDKLADNVGVVVRLRQTPREQAEAAFEMMSVMLPEADPAFLNHAFAPVPPAWSDMAARFFKLLRDLPFTAAEAEAIHQGLSGGIRTEASDGFLQAQLAQLRRQVDDTLRNGGRELAARSLNGRRFQRQRVHLEEATHLLGEGSNTRGSLEERLNEITHLLPDASEARDRYLESLLWAREIQSAEEVARIERLKSYHWAEVAPAAVNRLSEAAEVLEGFKPAEKMELMRYLLDPRLQERGIPASVDSAIVRVMRAVEQREMEALINTTGSSQGDRRLEQLSQRIQRQTDALRRSFTVWARDASPNERIPILALLVANGERPLVRDPAFINHAMREFLNLDPTSMKGRALRAFLRIVDPVELPGTLGYMLSRRSTNGGELAWNEIFNIFQSVGIKGGQLGAIWGLFQDEALNREAARLKDDAAPMLKHEILETMRRTMSPAEFARVRLKRIIGCASIKCVVLVEIEGQPGQHVVGVRRPHAEQLVRRNLDLARRYYRALQEEGVEVNPHLLDSLSRGLEAQLAGELSMREEARKLREAARHYAERNAEMHSMMGGWRFVTPRESPGITSNDELIFMGFVNGRPWGELRPETQREVGRYIVEAGLRNLFRDGYFNPDQHTGNFLVNEETREIFVLDPGQAHQLRTSRFGRDERYELAQVLRGIGEGNADAVVFHGMRLAHRTTLTRTQREALQQRVQEVLRSFHTAPGGDAFRNAVVGLTHAFSESGVRLQEELLFVGLKGLMVLSGENYVPPEQFVPLLSGEVRRTVESMPVRTALDSLRVNGRLPIGQAEASCPLIVGDGALTPR